MKLIRTNVEGAVMDTDDPLAACEKLYALADTILIDAAPLKGYDAKKLNAVMAQAVRILAQQGLELTTMRDVFRITAAAIADAIKIAGEIDDKDNSDN